MLLVDAYNVLGAEASLDTPIEGAPVGGLDLRGLARLLEDGRYARVRRRLVCDGRPTPADIRRGGWLETRDGLIWGRFGSTELVFSGRASSADDLIEESLRDRSTGVRYVVVSTDRRLVRAAGRAGADSIRSETFLRQLASDARARPVRELPGFVTDVPLDPYSVASWMREFGLEPSPFPEPLAPPEPGPPISSPLRTEPVDGGGFEDSPSENTAGPAPRVPRVPEPGPKRVPKIDPIAAPEPIDPLLARAFEEWRGRLDPADLDMKRWLPDVTPLRSRPPAPEPPRADA